MHCQSSGRLWFSVFQMSMYLETLADGPSYGLSNEASLQNREQVRHPQSRARQLLIRIGKGPGLVFPNSYNHYTGAQLRNTVVRGVEQFNVGNIS